MVDNHTSESDRDCKTLTHVGNGSGSLAKVKRISSILDYLCIEPVMELYPDEISSICHGHERKLCLKPQNGKIA